VVTPAGSSAYGDSGKGRCLAAWPSAYRILNVATDAYSEGVPLSTTVIPPLMTSVAWRTCRDSSASTLVLF
jgi:hypothetical protein